MSKPTEDEAREVSRRIPDEPSDVTFEVERHVVREGAGPARVVLPGMVKFFHAEDVETQRRTIRIVNGPWETVPEPADLVQGDAKLRENSGDADAIENHNEQEQR